MKLNSEMPLGLPQGSIRAIIAIGLTVAIIIAIFVNVTVPDVVFGFMAAIVGFYFASRENQHE
jgi:hypothetical protein